MLQVTIIGHIGADAEVRNDNGKEFISFRVAHTDKWTDGDNQQHTETYWVDCTMNGRPAVLPWLKRGQAVCIVGDARTRVYSSAKERCMKAGIRCSVRSIELVGSAADAIPSRLYDQDGIQHDVVRFYHTDCPGHILMSQRGQQYAVDDNGWVVPIEQVHAETADKDEDNGTKKAKGSKA